MQQNKNEIILDHVDNITFKSDSFPIKNMHALDYTRQGLYELALLVRERENDMNTRIGHYIQYMAAMGGDSNKLMNYFNWFSISIINYTRLIGFIDIVNKRQFTREKITQKENHKIIKKYCKDYIEKVIPDIYVYRNKLSAHHSLTDPLVDDNIATLETSVLNSIVYRNPYLETAGINLKLKLLPSDTEYQTTAIKPWQLTKVYDDLTMRYWNDMKIPKLEKSKIKLREDVVFSIWCPKCHFAKHKIEVCPKCGFREKGEPVKN